MITLFQCQMYYAKWQVNQGHLPKLVMKNINGYDMFKAGESVVKLYKIIYKNFIEHEVGW